MVTGINVPDRLIDWFAIDLDAFERAFKECSDALIWAQTIEHEIERCETGICDHERRLKKDGTPDLRSPCPMLERLHPRLNKAINDLYYNHHLELFMEIGLIRRDKKND